MMSAWGLRVNWRGGEDDGKGYWYSPGPGPGSFSLVLPERKPPQPWLVLEFHNKYYGSRKITRMPFFDFLADITFYF